MEIQSLRFQEVGQTQTEVFTLWLRSQNVSPKNITQGSYL